MPSITNNLRILLLSLLIAPACTTVTTQSFRATGNANVEASYIATDADFGRYSRLLGEDMGIFFPESSPVSEQDLQRIRQIFRSAFLAELKGYEIVQSPAPDVMTVAPSLIDLRKADLGDVPDMRVGLDAAAQPGTLVFMMELRDSSSGRVLARAADSTKNPRITSGGHATTDWDEVQSAADYWSALFRQFLDQNLGR